MDPPRDRKQRRAAEAAASTTYNPDIPLAHPPREDSLKRTDRPKTLYDIIAERQNELLGQQADSSTGLKSAVGLGLPSQPKGARFVTVDATGSLVDTDADINSQVPVNSGTHRTQSDGDSLPQTKKQGDNDSEVDKPLPPLLDTIMLAIPLTTLHLTLAYLAAHQYAESTNVPLLLKNAVTTVFPLLSFLIHFAHGHIVSFKLRRSLGFLAASNTQPISLFPFTQEKRTLSFLGRLFFPPTLRTIIFLPISVALGVHLITITNGEPYYAVMKKAPAYGTMWIWSILEMSFGPAVLGALGPLIWGVWWMGYGII